jgi:8-oxo-dGTP pyrophosphatase MutT (NUDIX family)
MLIEHCAVLSPEQSLQAVTREWLAARLAAPNDEVPRLQGDAVECAQAACGDAIAAAVLVPVVNRPTGPTLLLTQRSNHLADHAGQISFPGGRAEPEDADCIDTALREAAEEIGLAPGRVEVLGLLPEYWTITGYRVTPVVGWIEPPFSLTLDSYEVAEAFEVPLQFLMDPASHEERSYDYQGRSRSYFAMPYDGRLIWGATAAMIVNLHRILSHEPPVLRPA